MKQSESTKYELKEYALSMHAVAKNASHLAKKLSVLDQKSKDLIVGLLSFNQLIAVAERSEIKPEAQVVSEFYRSVEALSPAVFKRANFRALSYACMDESIAYASAMARCEEDGTPQDQCERGQLACRS